MIDRSRIGVIEELKPALARASNGRARLDALTEESLLIEDVGLASLDFLELRFDLESMCNTRLTDAEALKLRTIRDVVNVILERKQAGDL
jgi:acyl carrier protein